MASWTLSRPVTSYLFSKYHRKPASSASVHSLVPGCMFHGKAPLATYLDAKRSKAIRPERAWSCTRILSMLSSVLFTRPLSSYLRVEVFIHSTSVSAFGARSVISCLPFSSFCMRSANTFCADSWALAALSSATMALSCIASLLIAV